MKGVVMSISKEQIVAERTVKTECFDADGREISGELGMMNPHERPVASKTELPSIGVNDFVKRQTSDSKFSYFTGTWEELVGLAQAAFSEGKPGYRDGILEVAINPEGFFSNIVTLEDGDVLKGEFSSRTKDEAARKSFTVIRKGPSFTPAKSVDVIIYSEAVLKEGDEATTDADWEIISINAWPWEGETPIEPTTLMHNYFGSDGGTDTRQTPEEFVALLRSSFLMHHDKARVDPS